MAKRTGSDNPILQSLISELKKKSAEQNVAIWKRIATDLEKPTRQRRVVNLSRLNRYTSEDELVIVPGKVLGAGTLDHKLTIAAYQFSGGAKDKLLKNGSKIMPLEEISMHDPKGKKIRIMG